MATIDTSSQAGGGGRRSIPWWHWLVVGMLICVVAYLLLDLGGAPTPSVPTSNAVHILSELQDMEAIPAKAGDYAGCNIVLFTLDTTRADRLGCYGNRHIRTPAIDSLARQGAVFGQARATAPTTIPAHASIHTGLYPAHHGVRCNGHQLEESKRTLAELLSEQGYATGAMVSTYLLDARFGLDQGFDHYDDDRPDPGGSGPKRPSERRGDHTVERALAWLEKIDHENAYFLWLHLFDPHTPYLPPSPFLRDYDSAPYDGEIAFVDAQVAKVLKAIEQRDQVENTLIVIVGDHGEGLGQHGESTHAYLIYDSTLHVPLIFACGRRLGGGVHVRQRVSQVDLTPTILRLLGLEVPRELDGIDLTTDPIQPRALFAETLHGQIIRNLAPMTAVFYGPHKYLHSPKPELFDLSSDPSETKNIYDGRPALVAELKSKLNSLFGEELDLIESARPNPQLSAEDLRNLHSLGYLGGRDDAPAGAPRTDPKDVMAELTRTEQMKRSIEQKHLGRDGKHYLVIVILSIVTVLWLLRQRLGRVRRQAKG